MSHEKGDVLIASFSFYVVTFFFFLFSLVDLEFHQQIVISVPINSHQDIPRSGVSKVKVILISVF